MLTKLIYTLNLRLHKLECEIAKIVSSQFGPPMPQLAMAAPPHPSAPSRPTDLREVFGSILWMPAPKRKTSEKRVSMRKYGLPDKHWKLLSPKRIVLCLHCGSPREHDRICPSCYERSNEANAAAREAKEKDAFGDGAYRGSDAAAGKEQWFKNSLLTPKTPGAAGEPTVAVPPRVEVLGPSDGKQH